MAHNLFSDRFYQNRLQPAWHGLGINSQEPLSATEALARVGSYSVELRPIYVEANGSLEQTRHRQITRLPTSDDPVERLFGGPVSEHYALIGPEAATLLWDANVRDEKNRPVAVETLGVLGKGERLFMSTRLPGISVRGDEVATYLLYDNPLFGKSMGVYVVPVRVVCQNTLNAAIGHSIQTKRVTHTSGAALFIGDWLSRVYGNALKTVALMDQAFNRLANKPVTDVQVKWIVETTYPLPKRPVDESRSRRTLDERLEQYEYLLDVTNRTRKAVFELYHGAGVGWDSPAVKGTAFGAWNAVAEFETYRRGSMVSTGMKLIAGDRALRIRKAFGVAMRVDIDRAPVSAGGAQPDAAA